MIQVKRIYDEPDDNDGFRILIDRLWPRGISKDKAKVNLWLKEIAPGDELRKWFRHDPGKWEDFRDKYLKELQSHKQLLDKIMLAEEDYHTITLLYAAKDSKHNNAVVLLDMLRALV